MWERLVRKFKKTKLLPSRVIKVGALSAQTGPLADYGITAVQGLKLGIEYATAGSWEVAGRKIDLLIEDDGGDPDIASQKTRALIEQQGVHILQGCTSSPAAIKIARIAQKYQRLFLVAVAATDVLTAEWFNRYIFRTASTTAQDAAAGSTYAVEYLGHRFAFFSPDYIWGHQSRSAWWHAIEKQGGEIVGDVMVPRDTLDFRVDLHALLEQHPEVVVPSWAGRATADLFLQMHEVGVFDTVKVITDLPDRNAIHAVGEALAGTICVVKYYYDFPQNSVNNWLIRHHQEQYGTPPDLFTESGFTSGVALVEGLKRTTGDPTAEILIPVLEGMPFEGPKGTYTFRAEDHQALQPMYIVEMVKQPEQTTCVPRLIREISAEETAPPLVAPRSIRRQESPQS